MLDTLGVIYAGCDSECLSVTVHTHTPGAPAGSPGVAAGKGANSTSRTFCGLALLPPPGAGATESDREGVKTSTWREEGARRTAHGLGSISKSLLICRDVDGPGDCYTEWIAEREELNIIY